VKMAVNVLCSCASVFVVIIILVDDASNVYRCSIFYCSNAIILPIMDSPL